jgi:hypothetical protein
VGKKYTWNLQEHPGGGRASFSWVVLDPKGYRVKSGTAPTRAAATLAAEKIIWRFQRARETTGERPDRN